MLAGETVVTRSSTGAINTGSPLSPPATATPLSPGTSPAVSPGTPVRTVAAGAGQQAAMSGELFCVCNYSRNKVGK